jgi:hypothetical protein
MRLNHLLSHLLHHTRNLPYVRGAFVSVSIYMRVRRCLKGADKEGAYNLWSRSRRVWRPQTPGLAARTVTRGFIYIYICNLYYFNYFNLNLI